jgi:hypothetical protein
VKISNLSTKFIFVCAIVISSEICVESLTPSSGGNDRFYVRNSDGSIQEIDQKAALELVRPPQWSIYGYKEGFTPSPDKDAPGCFGVLSGPTIADVRQQLKQNQKSEDDYVKMYGKVDDHKTWYNHSGFVAIMPQGPQTNSGTGAITYQSGVSKIEAWKKEFEKQRNHFEKIMGLDQGKPLAEALNGENLKLQPGSILEGYYRDLQEAERQFSQIEAAMRGMDNTSDRVHRLLMDLEYQIFKVKTDQLNFDSMTRRPTQ